jgi:sepiapterin reductase
MAKLLLVVTGASRGLGRAIAKAFCSSHALTYPDNTEKITHIRAILVARSLNGLQETETEILQNGNDDTTAVQIECSKHAVDLGNLETLDGHLDDLFREISEHATAGSRLIFVNNAGTLGHLGPCIASPSLQDMRTNVDLNITSALWTSVRFARFAASSLAETFARTTIVNISSLVAVQPFPTMGVYSAGKAARDMYHTILAKEVVPSIIQVLNYAPGPLETDMATELRTAQTLDKDLKPHFEKQLVDPNDSALKLVALVTAGEFESGAHIDYYDLP